MMTYGGGTTHIWYTDIKTIDEKYYLEYRVIL
jgi:hypothetical protein